MTFRTLHAAFISLLLAVPALAAPTKLAQQGRVLDSTGQPLEGAHAMSFSLFDAATEGSSLWTEERNATFEAGYYSITLGEQAPLDDLLFAGESVWLEISIGGEALTPRQEVVSVPYALRATAADHVEGGMVDAEEISVDGTVVIDATGNWVGPTPAVGWGDISGVPADIADGDQDTDTLAGLACAEGQLPKWDATASLWVCGDDIDTDTTDPNTDTLLTLVCTAGQVAKWDGTAWSCGDDIDTDTTDPNTDVLADLACAEGQLPKWDATGSLWVCGEDIDTDTTDPNTDTLLTLVCTAGQVAKWDGTAWSCGEDIDTDTTDPNTDTLAALPCADGFVAKMDGTTGLWTCAPDADSFAELAGVCLPGDIPVLDPVSGSWTCGVDNDTVTASLPWSSITGIPADIADGDQDTVTLTLPWSSITGIPTDIADGDQDTVTLTLPWSSITGIPADIADGDQDTDTQLTEAQVDAMVANNGYIDGVDGQPIAPSSVTIDGTSTALTSGEIDLGPEADDSLTAAMVQTLAGGGMADSLHTHAAQAAGGEPTMMTDQTPSGMNFKQAMQHCRDLVEGGFNDWRLATIEEVFTVYQMAPVPTDYSGNYFWTRSRSSLGSAAFIVFRFSDSYVTTYSGSSSNPRARCVR